MSDESPSKVRPGRNGKGCSSPVETIRDPAAPPQNTYGNASRKCLMKGQSTLTP